MRNILFILLSLCLVTCLNDKLAGTASEADSGNEISLTGRVIDENNDPVSGVVVALTKIGLSDTTNTAGRYLIEKDTIVPDSNEILDTLVFIQDEQEIAKLNVTKWVDTLPDVRVVQRDISGKVESSKVQISKVEAVLWGYDIPQDQAILTEFFYSEATNTYSGFVYFPATDEVQDFSIYINVYGSEGNLIGRSEVFHFNSLAGDISIPTFNPNNAIPFVFLDADTTVSINDSVFLKATVVDSFGGEIVERAWSINGVNFIKSQRLDTMIIVPSEKTIDYPIILRVVDDEGNIAVDTLSIDVVEDFPIAKIMTLDSIVSINDTIFISSLAIDEYGTIVQKKWNVNGRDVQTSNGFDSTLTIVAPYEPDSNFSVVFTISDDDGLESSDSLLINVVRDPPTIEAEWDTTHQSPTTLKLLGSGTDDFGKIEHWFWKIGNSDFNEVSNPDTLIAKPTNSTELFCILKAIDDDGNEEYDSVLITVKVPSTEASLLNIILQGGTLVPSFNSDTLIYSHTIQHEIDSAYIMPTALDSNSTILIDGNFVISGTMSKGIYLEEGDNTIDIIVTAEDGISIKKYQLNLFRQFDFSGNWNGLTSQGLPIYFRVIQTNIDSLQMDVQVQGDICFIGTILSSKLVNKQILEKSFSFDVTASPISYTFRGSFFSSDSASGELFLYMNVVNPPNPVCTGQGSLMWSSKKD